MTKSKMHSGGQSLPQCRTWCSLATFLLAALFFAPASEPLAVTQSTLQSAQITALAERVRSGDRRAVQEFWAKVAISGTPLIEPIESDPNHHLVTFLWRAKSAVHNVLLISGLSNSSYSKTILHDNLLTHLPGTDIWYRNLPCAQ